MFHARTVSDWLGDCGFGLNDQHFLTGDNRAHGDRSGVFTSESVPHQKNTHMKTTTSLKPNLLLFAIAAAVLFLPACAEMASSNTKSLLSAAGFVVRSPETPVQKEIYASLPAYQLQRAHVNGKVFYVFKDEKAGVAYVGREPAYQRYQQLCIQQQVAQNYYMAAEMNSMYARRWYGAYGARGWY
jgi:hypothetical protein